MYCSSCGWSCDCCEVCPECGEDDTMVDDLPEEEEVDCMFEREEFLNATGKVLGFALDRDTAFAQHRCVKCGGFAVSFVDQISVNEYQLTGFCQTCQDEVFGNLGE